jgi:hypothetical protein
MAPAIRALPFRVCRARCSEREVAALVGSLLHSRSISPISRMRSTLSSRNRGRICGSISFSIRAARRSAALMVISGSTGSTVGSMDGSSIGSTADSTRGSSVGSTIGSTIGSSAGTGTGSATTVMAFSSAVSSASAPGMRRSATAPSMPSRAPAQRAKTKRCASLGTTPSTDRRVSAFSSARARAEIGMMPVAAEMLAVVCAARTTSLPGTSSMPSRA